MKQVAYTPAAMVMLAVVFASVASVSGRADGVRLSYDSTASLIAPAGGRQLSRRRESSTRKIEWLPKTAAR